MRLGSALGAVALLSAAADARITGMSVPATIKPGDNFKIKLDSVKVDPIGDFKENGDWLLNIAFGHVPLADAKPGTMGNYRLGEPASFPNEWQDYDGTLETQEFKIKDDVEPGKYVMAGIHFSTRTSAEGLGIPHLEEFRVTFEVGDETSKEYVDATSATVVGTCGGGDKTKAGGERTRSSGYKPGAGDDKTKPGDDKTKPGDDKPEAGDDKTKAGDDKPEAGDDKPEAGDDKPEAGDD